MQLLNIGECMLASLHMRRPAAEMPIQRIGQRMRRRIVLDCAVHAYPNVPDRCQRTPHLPQRRCAIGKELQPQLTEHNPELAILERKRERAALVPLDRHSARQSLRTGNGEHAAVHIQPSDMPTLPNARRRDPGNDTGAARHIQHPVAAPRRHPLHEVDRPRQRHRRTR